MSAIWEQSSGWDSVSKDYTARVTPFTSLFADDLVELAKLMEDFTVLDLATGPGVVARRAASKCKRVLAVDFSPEMISLLKETTSDELLKKISPLVADGTDMSRVVADCEVDCVLSNFGVLFFPDVSAGLREVWRVLVSGGKAVISTWSETARTPAFNVFKEAINETCSIETLEKIKKSAVTPAGMANLSTADGLAQACRSAGFSKEHCVQVVRREHNLVVSSPEEYWKRMAYGSPTTKARMGLLTSVEVERVHTEVIHRLSAEFGEGPVVLPAEAIIAVCTK